MFFGNLADPNFRVSFLHEDFSWNQSISPEVYLNLQPVALRDGTFVNVSEKEAENHFIEMSLVDTNSTLSDLLLAKKVSVEDVKKIVKTFNERVAELTKQKYQTLSSSNRSWYERWDQRLTDLDKFSQDQSFISRDLLQRAFKALHKNQSLDYFKNYQNTALSAAIDGHSDNIILFNNNITFLDVLLVKDDWRLIDPHFDICRLATDIQALGQPELLQELYQSSKHNPMSLPKKVRISYELYCACLKGSYNAIIGKNDVAQLYIPVIERLTEALEK